MDADGIDLYGTYGNVSVLRLPSPGVPRGVGAGRHIEDARLDHS